ncbi:hypothetical protein AK812_SmicGene8999 [Symbiodinium microadriaticum]|uniref:Uncharacterized protein n=1 Tax=Symbiodinium microadriaticum TaxID=2951 RepID=A0A1Q9EJE1_SYMMI|nr:hypothetical protein AK812_SmicGene8999 [Symbiodinium microadriaticum]
MIASASTVSLPKVFAARVQHGRAEPNHCHCLLPLSMLFGYQKLSNFPRLRKSLRRGGRVFRDISKARLVPWAAREDDTDLSVDTLESIYIGQVPARCLIQAIR